MTNRNHSKGKRTDKPVEEILTLEAYTAHERCAFYSRKDGKVTHYFNFSDPNKEDEEVSQDKVEYAITVVGWRALKKELTRRQLIEFLNAESIRVMGKLRGGKPPLSFDELCRKFLRQMTPEDIETCITQAEGVIDENDAPKVERLFHSLLKAKNLTEAQRTKIEGLLTKQQLT